MTQRLNGMTVLLVLGALLAVARPFAAHAQPIAKANFLAEGSFALPATGEGALQRPRAIAWAPGNRIHIADERGSVSVYAATGAFQRAYGGAPTLKRIAGMAVDAAGRSYVLDPEQKMVFVFDSAGTVKHKIGAPGNQAGQLDDPLDLALGPNGLVYVLDKSRKGVQVFSLDGTFVHDVMLPITVENPRALAVSPSGAVFVTDGELRTGLVRLPDLTVALGTVDAPPAEARSADLRGATLEEPTMVVATPTGTIIVGDRDTGVLWSLDGRGGAPAGTDDRLYGGSGSGRGSFRRLEDVAVAGADELVMLDGEGRKVERIRLVLEGQRAAEARMDYPVQFQSFAPTIDQGVIATAIRPGGTAWFAVADAQGRNLRVIEARMAEKVGVFGERIRVPEVVAGAAPRAFGPMVEQAGYAALNDTLLVVSEPRRNRFHVIDLRNNTAIGAFGDSYRDDRRLRDPRGVALFADGRIAVADHGNDRVVVFSPDVATLIGSYPLLKAQGVAVTPDGRLYAWDEEGLQAAALDQRGTFSALPGGLSTGGVGALTVDAAGNVYALRRGTGRVAILDVEMRRLLARVGAERGVEAGDHLTVDADGNIYATSSEKGTTAVVRWGVDLPPVSGLAAGWTPSAAELTWTAVPGAFVTGYQIEGAPAPNGPWTRVAATTEPKAQADNAAFLHYRVAARLLTGALGRPSEPVPVGHLAALAAFGRGEWAKARELTRSALGTVQAGGAKADAATVQALTWAGLVSAHELADYADVLVWDRQAGASLAQNRAFDRAFRLADTYQHLGQLEQASEMASQALRIGGGLDVQVATLRRLAFDNAWQLGRWETVSRVGEEILAAGAGAPDPTVLDRLIRAHLRGGSAERARALIDQADAAQPASTPRLKTLRFIAGSALGAFAESLPLATEVGSSIESDLFAAFQGALARARLETGDRPGARSALMALLADQRDAAALAEPVVTRSTLAVFGALIEAGEAESARGMLDSLVAALPDAQATVRSEVLRQADSVAAVADTRAKLGEGFAFYRDAQFRDAVRFFEAADQRTDLDVDQRLIVKELLAGSLYSFARTEDADEVFRGVFVVDPAFDLAAHLQHVQEVYGISIFTEEMLAHFSALAVPR
jgi:DNA-binding beta-propeller fold protein YncE/tetratricopeptide (TPR) repeat protein